MSTHKCKPICGALELELPDNVIGNMPAPDNMPPPDNIPAPGCFIQFIISRTTTRTTVPPHSSTPMRPPAELRSNIGIKALYISNLLATENGQLPDLDFFQSDRNHHTTDCSQSHQGNESNYTAGSNPLNTTGAAYQLPKSEQDKGEGSETA
ncbi:hypothetical protein MJO28_012891 [Puccinia striiformis f. sp. tritici]|uniref:Uncharacterized protein n=1 Tax=Puccinia striiformis f. sp. tritici TaxID=168172 RepID=A0ACC0DX68_9BASI|nr:hypothetical protein MJO28_012891 [Puccinia striiformis f. sp. tritici]